jgi:hypothetical protein
LKFYQSFNNLPLFFFLIKIGNGPEFEAAARQKHENNPKFAFLRGGEYQHYYGFRVQAEKTCKYHKNSFITFSYYFLVLQQPPNPFHLPPPNILTPPPPMPHHSSRATLPPFPGPPPPGTNGQLPPPWTVCLSLIYSKSISRLFSNHHHHIYFHQDHLHHPCLFHQFHHHLQL